MSLRINADRYTTRFFTPQGVKFWADVSRIHFGDTPKPVDVEKVMQAMKIKGGSFASDLASLWQIADSENRARIEKAFADLILHYWKEVCND